MKRKEAVDSAMLRRSFLKQTGAVGIGIAAGSSLGAVADCSVLSQGTADDRHVNESRRISVAKEADVVVVGGGISGLFAALAAGRMGVSTILIDRFGSLGGNLGPGYLVGGSAYGETSSALRNELPSVPREFFRRLEQLSDVDTNHRNYIDVSTRVSYLAFMMAEEAGIELILSAYGCDPIVENKVVKGVFVEGKSGRVAIRSKILIDATGDANIAERGGARVIRYVSWDLSAYTDIPPKHDPDLDYQRNMSELILYDEAGIYMMIGNADEREYVRFVTENQQISDDDRAWAEQHLVGKHKYHATPDAFIPLVRKARAAGGRYLPVRELKEHDITISSHWGHFGLGQFGSNIFGGRGAIATGRIDMGNMDMVSLLEKEMRQQAFEMVRFLKEYSPGFSHDSYLMFLSPFLGSRGGPFIDGEHTLTVQDMTSGRRFDDVVFRTYRRPRGIIRDIGDWDAESVDVPYRMMLPKGFDNMYVVARGSAFVRRGHDGVGQIRNRPIVMALGQAGGTAAAMCVLSGCSAQTLDIKSLQKELVRQGFNLGEAERLRELDLRDGDTVGRRGRGRRKRLADEAVPGIGSVDGWSSFRADNV